MSEQEEIQLDSIVLSVIQKFKERATFGKKKYGTDLDREDLKVKDWIQHAQEELMDGILYLEKLKVSIQQQQQSKKEESTTLPRNSSFEEHWGC
jgi:hypothetical protein